MQLVSNEISTDNAAYTLERAMAFGRSAPELHSLLGSFGLFLAGESDTTPTKDWIEEADDALIKEDPRIAQARKNLDSERRNHGNEQLAAERSRSTEWVVLLEMFIAVIPESSESAA